MTSGTSGSVALATTSLPRRAAFAALAVAAVPESARALPARPPGAPRPSDVPFSARWPRPEALDAARAFGATRLDWCYTHDAAFLSAARAAGLSPLGGALNTILADRVGGAERRLGRITDAEGHPVTAPWMRWPGISWGCVNSPDYRATWLAHARAGLESGLDGFLVDDPGMNADAVRWGGCHCRHCRARAAQEGADLPRDMAVFQRRAVERFHREMREAVDALAGRRVPFAVNNFRGRWNGEHAPFDHGIAEVDERDCEPASIASLLRTAEAAGRPQVLTLRSEDVALNRRMIAWCYANGGHLLAPWDVYLRSTSAGSDRFFGRPQDFAPLYRFARGIAPLLDGAVPDAAPRGAWSADRPGVLGALRTAPDRSFAALHLVPWDAPWDAGEPFALTLHAALLLPGGRRASIRAPGHGPMPLTPGTPERVPSAPWLVVEVRKD